MQYCASCNAWGPDISPHSCQPTTPTTYEQAGQELGKLVDAKQLAYGDSFGKSGQIMRILYPHGVSDAQLDDALTVVRILDKLFRVATSRDALGESPWKDIAGYALLASKEKNR